MKEAAREAPARLGFLSGLSRPKLGLRLRAQSLAISPRMALCWAVAVIACLPIWLVRYLPVQDLPIHMAAIRVIHSYSDMTYGFAGVYALTLSKTQYLLFYLAGSALSYAVGVRGAVTALVTFYVVGTVIGTARLARTLGKDERISLFTIPFIYNCSFVIGFLPFLIGIPLLLLSLEWAVRHLGAPTRASGAVLALLVIALFYSHVAPFLMFAAGFGALFLFRARRRWVADLAPCVPVALLFVHWLFGTEAGRVTLETVTTKGDPPWEYDVAISKVYDLAFNVFRDTSDEAIFFALLAVGVVVLSLAQGERDRTIPAARVLLVLPLLSLYLFLHSGHRVGYVAHIRDRFPILFVFTLIPLLHFPKRWRAVVASALLFFLDAASSYNTLEHFRRFQDEVGGLDRALGAMDSRRAVGALIYDNASQVMTQAPFLHFGSYYQVDKGGIVQFTFAGYPHWPFAFKPGAEIPPNNPYGEGWCWGPQSISVEKALHPYFDYVLTRGGSFHPPSQLYRPIYEDSRWHVFRRVSGEGAGK